MSFQRYDEAEAKGLETLRQAIEADIEKATLILRAGKKLTMDTFELLHYADRLRMQTKTPADSLLALTAMLANGLKYAGVRDVDWSEVIRKFAPDDHRPYSLTTSGAEEMYALLLVNKGIAATLKGGAEAIATASAKSALALLEKRHNPSLNRWRGTALLIWAANEPQGSDERQRLATKALPLINQDNSPELFVYAKGVAGVGSGLIEARKFFKQNARVAGFSKADLYRFNE